MLLILLNFDVMAENYGEEEGQWKIAMEAFLRPAEHSKM
jgi:hypothetical protein